MWDPERCRRVPRHWVWKWEREGKGLLLHQQQREQLIRSQAVGVVAQWVQWMHWVQWCSRWVCVMDVVAHGRTGVVRAGGITVGTVGMDIMAQ